MLRAAGDLEAEMNPGGLVPTAILIITRPVRFEVGEPRRDLDFDFEGVQAVQAKSTGPLSSSPSRRFSEPSALTTSCPAWCGQRTWSPCWCRPDTRSPTSPVRGHG
jgi:hypothetical protein